jgi:hypothetical protein
MTEPAVIDGTAVEEPEGDAVQASPEPVTAPEPESGRELAVLAPDAGTIIRADEPEEVLAKAVRIARPLKDLIDQAGLAASMGGRKKHIEVGGWQACGAMLGALGGTPLHAETSWTRRVMDADGGYHRTAYTATVTRYPQGKGTGKPVEVTTYEVDGFDWEACVEIKTAAGVVVGKAEAMVGRDEETWNTRSDHALRAMAETRAEGRAWRKAISWIVHLAGYSPTPAEEMPQHAEPEWWAVEASDERKRDLLERLTTILYGNREAAVALLQSVKGRIGVTPELLPAFVGGLLTALQQLESEGAQPESEGAQNG